MPIYPSPLKDDGYDIADFRKIHPTIGTVEDFEALTKAAHARGIRIIADLVVNHTSDQHPWFQEARRDPNSPEARLLRLERHRPEVPGRPDHLQGHRAVELDLGPDRPAVLLAPFLQPPARPELRQPGRPPRDARHHRLLARPRHRRLPGRRRALPLRARGDQLREPARRRTEFLKEMRRVRRRSVPGDPASGRGQPVAERPAPLLRRGRRVPDGVQLPAHAPAVHGDPPRGQPADHRHHVADALDPADLPVGAVPPQPRRADARDGDRRGARLHV